MPSFKRKIICISHTTLMPLTISFVCIVLQLLGSEHFHAQSHPSNIDRNASTAHDHSLTSSWMPLAINCHRIWAVGPYRLPEQLLLPHNITPVSPALAYVDSGNYMTMVLVFFKPNEEGKVKEWANKYPSLTGGDGHAKWVTKHEEAIRKSDEPDEELKWIEWNAIGEAMSWHIWGVAAHKDMVYGVDWRALPTVDDRQMQSDHKLRTLLSMFAADYIGHGSGVNWKPLQSLSGTRHVYMAISIGRNHAPHMGLALPAR